MVAPLVAPFVSLAADARPLGVGDIVANFGQVARVVAVDERGLVLRDMFGSRSKWIADPAKCRPVR